MLLKMIDGKRKRDNIRRRKSVVLLSRRWTIATGFFLYSFVEISRSVNQIFRISCWDESNMLLNQTQVLLNKWSITYLASKRKNLRFVSVDCQVLLSTAVSMRISFLLIFSFSLSSCLKCLWLLSLSLFATLPSFLTFYCSLLFFSRSSLFQLDYDYLFSSQLSRRERERKKKKMEFVIQFYSTYIIVSNKNESVVLKCSKEIR